MKGLSEIIKCQLSGRPFWENLDTKQICQTKLDHRLMAKVDSLQKLVYHRT
jgi:hypothetical protein